MRRLPAIEAKLSLLPAQPPSLISKGRRAVMTDRRFTLVATDEEKPLVLSFSLLRLSAPIRLAIAATIVLALSGAVMWAIG